MPVTVDPREASSAAASVAPASSKEGTWLFRSHLAPLDPDARFTGSPTWPPSATRPA